MARIHPRVLNTRVSAAADCRDGQRGLVLGVTRDSLDFNRSLRGLFYLLQKHRLRYTIKLPAVRGLVPLSFLSLSLSLLLFLALLSPFVRSFRLSWPRPFVSISGLFYCRRRVASLLRPL